MAKRARAATADLLLEEVAPGRYRVAGTVSHASARAAFLATCEVLAERMARNGSQAGAIMLDLSGVTSGNSLVLSLMLSWLRLARAGGQELRFESVPAALVEQIRFTGLNHILPLAETRTEMRS